MLCFTLLGPYGPSNIFELFHFFLFFISFMVMSHLNSGANCIDYGFSDFNQLRKNTVSVKSALYALILHKCCITTDFRWVHLALANMGQSIEFNCDDRAKMRTGTLIYKIRINQAMDEWFVWLVRQVIHVRWLDRWSNDEQTLIVLKHTFSPKNIFYPVHILKCEQKLQHYYWLHCICLQKICWGFNIHSKF